MKGRNVVLCSKTGFLSWKSVFSFLSNLSSKSARFHDELSIFLQQRQESCTELMGKWEKVNVTKGPNSPSRRTTILNSYNEDQGLQNFR